MRAMANEVMIGLDRDRGSRSDSGDPKLDPDDDPSWHTCPRDKKQEQQLSFMFDAMEDTMGGQGTEFGSSAVSMLLLTLVSLGASGELEAQVSANLNADVTFTRDVAPILQENCVRCHRAGGGMAPMSLETYEIARTYAPLIKYKTGLRDVAGAMPPWFVEKDIGIQEFKNDMSLTDEEVATLAAWADNGAPQGDPADMPPPREFDDSGDWTIRPDVVVTSQELFVEALAPDWWGEIEPMLVPLEEDRYVAAVEIREVNDIPRAGPGSATVGGRFIIHHLNYSTNVPGQPRSRQGWPVHEVGRNADIFNADAGRLMRAGSVITSSSLHLHANGRDTRARLEIAFQLHPVGYEPRYGGRGEGITIGNTVNMDIRANEAGQEVHAYGVLSDHTMITSFEPHLHAPGERMCLEAIWGSKAETLSCVGYDHSWVRTYFYADDHQPLLPAGTILHIIGYVNNSETNPNVSYAENWAGGGNRSVSNMFLELGEQVSLTDEQFVQAMAERVESLNLTKADYVIGCPLCLATIPPPSATLSPR